jgi:hypothetical protein
MPNAKRKTTKRAHLPIGDDRRSLGSLSECEAVRCELEATIAGAKALIGIRHPHDDPGGSLLQAARLLDKALGMSEELEELLGPDIAAQIEDEIARRRAKPEAN